MISTLLGLLKLICLMFGVCVISIYLRNIIDGKESSIKDIGKIFEYAKDAIKNLTNQIKNDDENKN